MTPLAYLSSVDLMTFLSEAQHQMQMRTGAAKRTIMVDLTTLGPDGSIAVPLGLDSVTMATYQATPTPQNPVPIKPISFDYFQQLIYGVTNSGGNIPPPSVQLTPPQNGGAIMMAVQYNKFYFYPYVNATGVVTVQYKPSLQAYAPSETVLWPGYGADPTDAMAANGPEPEFQMAEFGIKEFAVAQICLKAPLGLRVWGSRYEIAMNNFEKQMEIVARRAGDDYSAARKPPYKLSPVF